MERALLGNIRKIYAIGICHSMELIVPVFVPLLLGKELSMAEILQTQAIFALTVAMFEVPSGYLADLVGRKVSLVLAAFLTLLAYACLMYAETFADFIVFEVVMGIALSLTSGADMAMLFDSQLALQKLNKKFQLPVSIGRLVSMSSAAEGLAAVAVSVLFLSSDTEFAFQTILAVQVVLALPPLLISFTLMEPPRAVSIGGHRENASKIVGTLIRGDRMVFWLALSMVAYGLVALCAFWTFQRFWQLQSVPLEWFGMLWAVHCGLRALSAQFAPWLESTLGSSRLLLLLAALPILGFLGMAGLPGWAGVACAFLFPLCRGACAVTLFDSLNRRVDGEFRATINSLVSLVIRALFILGGPVLGFAVDHYGVRQSLLGLGLIALPVFVAVTLALLSAIRHQSDNAADPAAQDAVAKATVRD